MNKDVIGLFDGLNSMERTINDLESSGFDRAMISILRSNVGQKMSGQEKLDYLEKNLDNIERLEPNKRDSFFIAKGTFTFISIYLAVIIALVIFGLDYLYTSPLAFMGYTFLILIPTFAICYFLARQIGQRFEKKEEKELNTGGIALLVKAANKSLSAKAQECMQRNNGIVRLA